VWGKYKLKKPQEGEAKCKKKFKRIQRGKKDHGFGKGRKKDKGKRDSHRQTRVMVGCEDLGKKQTSKGGKGHGVKNLQE